MFTFGQFFFFYKWWNVCFCVISEEFPFSQLDFIFHSVLFQFQLSTYRELQSLIAERLIQSEGLVFQEQALSTLCHLLTQDLLRYKEEKQNLTSFTQKTLRISQRHPDPH